MIFLTGGGSLLTRVGMAMIWSPLSSWGLLQQVNHRDAVLDAQLVLTNLLEVGDGGTRIRGLARDVKPQHKKITPAGRGTATLPC